MHATKTTCVTRVYRVALMPDPDTTYDPFFVTLSYTAAEAAHLDARSSRATSEAFRAAVAIERSTHHTPPHRRFFCASSEFVTDWTLAAPPGRAVPQRQHTHGATSPLRGSHSGGGVRVG